MDAATNTGLAAQNQDDGSNGEFIVHTKHTCDTCYLQPIIGKRYTSNVHSNYDLCARCFGAYSGPEIGLTEAVLVRDKKYSRDFVLKLKVNNRGEEQVRRVNVSEIWGKSISGLSFGKMMSIAASYAFPENKVDDAAFAAFTGKAKVTYIDEDGDKITMTSNAELEDAFRQVLKKSPRNKPFRITVTIPQDGPNKVAVPKLPAHRLQFTPKLKPPTMEEKSKTAPRVTPQEFEKEFFIHARHTCDGCSKSPIIGTRHHATKIPDFDLCGACFAKYEGEDLDFKEDINVRDRRMQRKWLKKKQLSDSIAGTWDKANGDIADFLKKVQEAGGVIESAEVIHTGPPCQGYSAKARKNSAELSTAKAAAGDVSDHLEKKEESAKVEAAGSLKDEESAKVEAAGSMRDEESAKVEAADSLKEEESVKVEAAGSLKDEEPVKVEAPVKKDEEPIDEEPIDEEATESPVASQDESFLSDADGSGSIAEAIGRTLDVCVQAIEEAMVDELEKFDDYAGSDGKSQKSSSVGKTSTVENAAASVAVDAFSVASSMVSSMTEVLKKMEEVKKVDDASQAVLSQSHTTVDAAASTGVPSVVTGATILKSEDGTEKKAVGLPKVEDASDGEDEWSVVSDEKSQAKNGKAVVFDWDIGAEKPKVESEADKSVFSVEPLAPVLLAKWDTELHQLHELGFLDDRKNVDVLEALEASHVAVDSTEKVTINAALGRLLDGMGLMG